MPMAAGQAAPTQKGPGEHRPGLSRSIFTAGASPRMPAGSRARRIKCLQDQAATFEMVTTVSSTRALIGSIASLAVFTDISESLVLSATKLSNDDLA